MGVWVDAARESMRTVLNELAAIRTMPLDDNDRELTEEPHWTTLEGMLDDYRLARVLDASDLVARLEGPSLEAGTSAVLLSRVVGDMWKQVKTATALTIALSSTADTTLALWAPRWPESLNMDVTGTGGGSLFLGFRASRSPHPEIGFQDAGITAMQEVMAGIADAASFLTDTGVHREISDRYPDPAILDSILSAVYHLAPTGRRGINAVTFYGCGEDLPPLPAAPLTPETRKILKPLLDQPVTPDAHAVFQGRIRAVDLDARRFVLRGVPKHGAVRCVYPARLDRRVRSMLASGAIVAVEGAYSPKHPRLMQVLNGIRSVDP
ncbi:MAG: hypothetical protein OXJ90_18235 [Spirochaetaceae bacterium]|nr:hypothetical protein [Spirochaetaceae bacterium]